ncbi:hypothetical protein PoB_001972100 [Plakobranchus ocellatus]|uniref:Uncharacterized protein n=1 Tax=Plakobranchus ocellatus TaxID=259542 RepID=A0AAV3Z1M3_9GAST|nr:hypothetical protein PoB_001972100 [Plakobranchus ocellatus]
MASNVYIAMICILLCSVICIIDGYPRRQQRYVKRCEAFGKYYKHGRIYRMVHFNTCFTRKCIKDQWGSFMIECENGGFCYPKGKVALIGGEIRMCDTKNNIRAKWLLIG